VVRSKKSGGIISRIGRNRKATAIETGYPVVQIKPIDNTRQSSPAHPCGAAENRAPHGAKRFGMADLRSSATKTVRRKHWRSLAIMAGCRDFQTRYPNL
jgi:hypothetical protein